MGNVPDKKYLIDVLRGEINRLMQSMAKEVHQQYDSVGLKADLRLILRFYCFMISETTLLIKPLTYQDSLKKFKNNFIQTALPSYRFARFYRNLVMKYSSHPEIVKEKVLQKSKQWKNKRYYWQYLVPAMETLCLKYLEASYKVWELGGYSEKTFPQQQQIHEPLIASLRKQLICLLSTVKKLDSRDLKPTPLRCFVSEFYMMVCFYAGYAAGLLGMELAFFSQHGLDVLDQCSKIPPIDLGTLKDKNSSISSYH